MRTLSLSFRIDNGSGGFASPTLTLDSEIATYDITLKRICITARDYSSSDYHRLIAIQLPFLNSISNNGSYPVNNTIVIPLPKDNAVSYTCNENYDVVNHAIPYQFDVKLFDYNGANSNNIPNHCYVSLIFEIDDIGTL